MSSACRSTRCNQLSGVVHHLFGDAQGVGDGRGDGVGRRSLGECFQGKPETVKPAAPAAEKLDKGTAIDASLL